MIPDWPKAHGRPEFKGVLRSCPEDFRVDEIPLLDPDGEGEHCWLQVEKRGANTEWVGRQLVRFAEVDRRALSWAGLKDRHAVTTQWFSVQMPGKADPDWSQCFDDSFRILRSERHSRKLRVGALKGNRFQITLRQVEGDLKALQDKISVCAQAGVPNGFGEQRFGRNGSNIERAQEMFAGRREKDKHKRGLYLSAARSWLFNQVLARRVLDQNWNTGLAGEAFVLEGSHSHFIVEEIDETIKTRVAELDIHPSGPLWGRGELACKSAALAFESSVLTEWAEYCEGLERAGLKQERRALRLAVPDLSLEEVDASSLSLSFTLPAGAYATAVLREIAEYSDASATPLA